MVDLANSHDGPLSQDDIAWIQYELIVAALTAIGQGIFLLLAGMAIYILIRKGLGASLPRRFLFSAVIILTLSTTTIFVSLLVSFIRDVTKYGPDPLSLSPSTSLGIAEIVCDGVNYFISDLIVVWRAWVLSNRLFSRVSLTICILATFGSITVESVFGIRRIIDMNFAEKVPLVDLLMMMPLIATNVLATSIVAYETWIYRIEIKVHFTQQAGKRRIEKVLVLLIESGLLYCAIWILHVLTLITGTSVWFAFELSAILPFISAIYPVLIILLVELGKTDAVSFDGASLTSHSITSTPKPARLSQSSHSIIQCLADHIQCIHYDGQVQVAESFHVKFDTTTYDSGSIRTIS